MKKAEFEERLKAFNLTKKDFSTLTGLAYSSIANWHDEKKPIPTWVGSWLDNYKYKYLCDKIKLEFDKFME